MTCFRRGAFDKNPVLGTADNVVFVTEKNDFPAASSGVITLEDNVLYWITGTVDLTGDRIVVGQNTVIVGSSSENSRLKSTGLTGTALITSEWSLPMRNIGITADIAVALDANGNANQALDWIAVNFVDCGQVGTIANYSNFVYNFSALLNSGGFTFDGSTGSIVMETSLLQGDGTGKTLVTIPSTATVTRRLRLSNCAIVAFGSDTAFNVSTSATIPVEGYILDAVNFSGGATYITGVQYDDNKAWFRECRGVQNSAEIGQYTMQGNATATTIGATGTPVKVAGTTVGGSLVQKFTHTSNRLTYTGAVTRDFKVTVTLSATAGNGNQVGIYVAKNGTVIDESETYITTNASGRLENGSVQTLVELAQNDYIEIWVENNTSVTNVTVEDLNVITESVN